MKLAVTLVALVVLAILPQNEADEKAPPSDSARIYPFRCQRYCQVSCPNGYCSCVAGCYGGPHRIPMCYMRKCCKCRCASNGDAECRAYRNWWCPYPHPLPVKDVKEQVQQPA
ncbi:hypothetical protein LSAT2_000600 [Lamellibrachia satsuma]|nr:hypothetical protein LSAT2_000600 [Lamellibrachia satsuma]